MPSYQRFKCGSAPIELEFCRLSICSQELSVVMPSCKYLIDRILTSIATFICRKLTILEDTRYFSPRNSCSRSNAGNIYATLIFHLPFSGTSDGRFS